MKRLLVILSLLMPLFLKAESVYFEGLFYEIVTSWESGSAKEHVCVVAGEEYGKYYGDVVVPDKIVFNNVEYPVAEIGYYAFYNCYDLMSVILPESVISIDYGAFQNCINLREIRLPSTLLSLNSHCFDNCRSLTTIELPESLIALGDYCFTTCMSLMEIRLPEGLKSIGEGCFQTCRALKSLSIPPSVSHIGGWCFCDGPKFIDFEESDDVLYLGVSPMSGSYGYNSVKIQRPIQYSTTFTESIGLQSLMIGSNIEDVSWINLSNESNLTMMSVASLAPPKTSRFTQSQYDNVRLYLPAQAIENYLNDENWAFFRNMIPLDNDFNDYKLSISTDSISLNVGEKTKFYYSMFPEVDSDIYVYSSPTWSPEGYDERIIEIDNSSVYAIHPGKGQITLISGLNGQIKTCEVSVIQSVTSIVLNKSTMSLHQGQSGKLFANLSPVDASDRSIIWSTSNSSVATVKEGLVYAEGVGDCLVFATAHNGVTASCAVTVLPTLVEELIIEPDSIEGNIGEKVQLNLTILPEVVTDSTVTWFSDNSEIASVDEYGLLSLNGIGTCKVRVMANDESGITKTCSVKVLPVLIDNITLNPSLIKPVKDLEIQIEARVFPEQATEKTLIWESDNTELASVDEYGLVKIHAIGDCRIIAKAIDGSGVEAECMISEGEGVESIFTDGIECEVYTINGFLVGKNFNITSLYELSQGIYILRNGNRTVIVKI
ncbi:MAG: leucine-rich repeat protein [Muribaculaceae bacterium]|nr:leucine-rich repeat protein [Muribaculaceae bacterium]